MVSDILQYQSIAAPVLLEDDPVAADTSIEWLPSLPVRRSRPPRRRHPDGERDELLGLGLVESQRTDWLPVYPPRANPRPRLRHQTFTYVEDVAETLTEALVPLIESGHSPSEEPQER